MFAIGSQWKKRHTRSLVWSVRIRKGNSHWRDQGRRDGKIFRLIIQLMSKKQGSIRHYYTSSDARLVSAQMTWRRVRGTESNLSTTSCDKRFDSVDVLTLWWIFCNVFFASVSQQREHLKYYEDNIKQLKEDFKINKQKYKSKWFHISIKSFRIFITFSQVYIPFT